MKIHIYGFKPDHSVAPRAVPVEHLFEAFRDNAGRPVDSKELLRISAVELPWVHQGKQESWWAGMMIRARDAKSFNKLTSKNGKLTLTTEDIKDGKLAEVAYFIANKQTQNGFIASYHGGPTLPVFLAIGKKLFRGRARQLMESEIEGAGDDEARKQAIRKSHSGMFVASYMVPPNSNLKKMLRSLHRVHRLEINYTTVATRSTLFSGYRAHAQSCKEVLVFPPGFHQTDPLIDELIKDGAPGFINGIKSASVIGEISKGNKKTIHMDMEKNLTVFGEVDYDSIIGNLSVTLDKWDDCIRDSKVVEWLLKQTNSPDNRLLLES